MSSNTLPQSLLDMPHWDTPESRARVYAAFDKAIVVACNEGRINNNIRWNVLRTLEREIERAQSEYVKNHPLTQG